MIIISSDVSPMQQAESVIIMKKIKQLIEFGCMAQQRLRSEYPKGPNENARQGAVPVQYITSTVLELPRDIHGQFNNEQPVVWLQRTILQSINYTIMTNHNS